MSRTILNQTRHVVLADRAEIARTVFSRMRGLLGRKDFLSGEALVIPGCQSIHMMFMRFPIDVLFLDKHRRVVGFVENIPPFSFSPVFWRAASAIELPPGTVAASRTQMGDEISF